MSAASVSGGSSSQCYVTTAKRTPSQAARRKSNAAGKTNERLPFRAYLEQKRLLAATAAETIPTSTSTHTIELELQPAVDEEDEHDEEENCRAISPSYEPLYVHASLRKSPSAPPLSTTFTAECQTTELPNASRSGFSRFARRLRSPYLFDERRASSRARRRAASTNKKKVGAKSKKKPLKILEWLVLAYRWVLWLIETHYPASDPEKLENDDSEDEDMARTRYAPASLDLLAVKTCFTPQEVRCMYRGFKNDCPSGVVDRDTFKDIFCSFFPFGDASTYAELVFNSVDVDDADELTFEQYLIALSSMARGTLREKIDWIYALYDNKRSGFVTRADFVNVARAMYDMLGASVRSPPSPNSAIEQANKAFDRMDTNYDGLITKAEFLAACLRSQNILDSLHNMDTLIRI